MTVTFMITKGGGSVTSTRHSQLRFTATGQGQPGTHKARTTTRQHVTTRNWIFLTLKRQMPRTSPQTHGMLDLANLQATAKPAQPRAHVINTRRHEAASATSVRPFATRHRRHTPLLRCHHHHRRPRARRRCTRAPRHGRRTPHRHSSRRRRSRCFRRRHRHRHRRHHIRRHTRRRGASCAALRRRRGGLVAPTAVHSHARRAAATQRTGALTPCAGWSPCSALR